MKWVTREKAKVDRIACPWLITKFVDPKSEFLFVPREKVLDVAKEQNAIPYDSPGAELHHYKEGGDERCSFDAIIKKYKLTDRALLDMATVRVKRIVCRELEPHVLEIVFRVLTEPEGHRLQARALRSRSSRPRVRRSHDLRHIEESSIRELVLLDDSVEAAPLVASLLVVVELGTGAVIRYRVLFLRDVQDLFARHEQELRLRIHEFRDEPRTRDPVYLRLLSGYPFHSKPSLGRVSTQVVYLCILICPTSWSAWPLRAVELAYVRV